MKLGLDVEHGDSLRLVILEFDVQAVLDPDFHLDRVIAIWRHSERVHPYVGFLRDIRYSSRDRHSHEVSSEQVNDTQDAYKRRQQTVASR